MHCSTDDDQLITGSAAFAQARVKPRRIHNGFWSDLQTAPLADRRFHHLSAADIVSRQLEQIWQRKSADAIVVAVPAYMTTANLSLFFLGIAAELRIPVAGMVDAAVAGDPPRIPGRRASPRGSEPAFIVAHAPGAIRPGVG